MKEESWLIVINGEDNRSVLAVRMARDINLSYILIGHKHHFTDQINA